MDKRVIFWLITGRRNGDDEDSVATFATEEGQARREALQRFVNNTLDVPGDAQEAIDRDDVYINAVYRSASPIVRD